MTSFHDIVLNGSGQGAANAIGGEAKKSAEAKIDTFQIFQQPGPGKRYRSAVGEPRPSDRRWRCERAILPQARRQWLIPLRALPR